MRVKNKKVVYLFGVILLAIFNFSSAFAQADESGSKDHPLISRFPGSSILVYDTKDFNEYVVPLGKMVKSKPAKTQNLEGKVTQITYATPLNRSILEIFHNYESALKNSGFLTLFSGKKNELGDKWLGEFERATERRIPYGGAGIGIRLEGDFRYMVAKMTRAEGDVYVALCVGSSWVQNSPVVQLDIIETKPIETGLVIVNAEALAKDIEKTGHASVYGIYFDTGKADVKPQSEEALAEIANLLKQDNTLNLYVVGHTDNVGTLPSNMELSNRRAESVVKVLVAKYSISTDRIHAAGVGPLSPVLTNKSEEGRSKNRRVELVKQ
jgi:flagellar motor protein MotB